MDQMRPKVCFGTACQLRMCLTFLKGCKEEGEEAEGDGEGEGEEEDDVEE